MRVSLTLLSVTFLSFGGCSARGDLDKLCAIVAQSMADESEPAQRAFLMAERLDREIRHREVRQMIDAISAAVADQKYALFKVGAAELGYPDWQCEAMEQLWGQTDNANHGN